MCDRPALHAALLIADSDIFGTGYRPTDLLSSFVKNTIPPTGENLRVCALMWLAVSVPWRRITMGQTTRLLKPANVLPDLLKMLHEREDLREKVRVAEAARVLH